MAESITDQDHDGLSAKPTGAFCLSSGHVWHNVALIRAFGSYYVIYWSSANENEIGKGFTRPV
jgi:hypothetical protein